MKKFTKKLPIVVGVLIGVMVIAAFSLKGNVNEKISVCHNGHVINISINALSAHMAHGDRIGDCGRVAPDPSPYESYDEIQVP